MQMTLNFEPNPKDDINSYNIQYHSIGLINDDIADPEDSNIFEHIQSKNIDNDFFTTFCEQVREAQQQALVPPTEYSDEWAIINQRMMENKEFDNDVYNTTTNYFRQEEVR